MNITRDEAAQALSDIARTEGRSHALYGYRVAGPIFIVWGIIWAIGYTAMGLTPPDLWGLVWLPIDIFGIVATIVMGLRGKRQESGSGQVFGGRMLGSFVLITIFCTGLFSMVHPADLNVYLAFPGLLTGVIYGMIGLWGMTRFLWVGLVVTACTLTGYFLFSAYLPYWMAVAGGGGLIVSGILVRRT